jgi:hypothetical protein
MAGCVFSHARQVGKHLQKNVRNLKLAFIELRFIKLRLVSGIHQSKTSPRENHCPSLGSTASATPLGGLWVRPCVVPCLARDVPPAPLKEPLDATEVGVPSFHWQRGLLEFEASLKVNGGGMITAVLLS